MHTEKSIKRKEWPKHGSNSRKEESDNAGQRRRRPASISSRRLQSLQKGSWASLVRQRCLRRLSCPIARRNSATALRLGHFGLLWSLFHQIFLEFLSKYWFWTKFFIFFLMRSLMLSKGIVVLDVYKIEAPCLARKSARSLPATQQCPGIHCNKTCFERTYKVFNIIILFQFCVPKYNDYALKI